MWLFDQSESRNVHFDPGFIQLPLMAEHPLLQWSWPTWLQLRGFLFSYPQELGPPQPIYTTYFRPIQPPISPENIPKFRSIWSDCGRLPVVGQTLCDRLKPLKVARDWSFGGTRLSVIFLVRSFSAFCAHCFLYFSLNKLFCGKCTSTNSLCT